MKNQLEIDLEYFGQDDFSFQQAKKYLVLLFQQKNSCDTMDQFMLLLFSSNKVSLLITSLGYLI